MKRVSCAAAIAALLGSTTAGAQTLSGPPTSGQVVLRPEADYATGKWGDAWDMDRRTDIGFLTWGVEAPNIASKTMVGCTNGVTGCTSFRFSSTSGSAQIYLLDTWQPGSAIVNKVGAATPIDTTKYKYLLVKMKVTTGVAQSEYGPPPGFNGAPQFQVWWSRNTIYRSPSRPNSGPLVSLTGAGFGNPGVVMDGDGVESDQYQIYAIRLDQIHWFNPELNPPPPIVDLGAVWGSAGVTGDSLFLTLPHTADYASRFGNIDIDWARLTTFDQSLVKTISWSGGGIFDIVIAPSAGCGGYTVLAESQATGFQFDFSALAPGTYYVGLRPSKGDGPNIAQSGVQVCSGGAWVVPGAASLTFTTPTDEGSNDDFATSFLGNAWDFNTLADMDVINDLTGTSIDPAFPAQRPDGTPLGNVRVLKGTSITGSDAYVYPLHFNSPRGLDNRIDTSRYRILSYEMGLDTSRDINLGSVSRVIWHIDGDATRNASGGVTRALENVSDDIVLRHLRTGTEITGAFVLDRIQLDMKDRRTFPVETDPDPPAPSEASPSRSGWTNACIQPFCPAAFPPSKPGADGLRIRFHEFPQPTVTYIRQIKLAALEKTAGVYTIAWSVSVPPEYQSPVVKLYASRQTQSAPTAAFQPSTGLELTPTAACDNQLSGGSVDGNLIPLNGAGTPFATGSFAWNVNGISTTTLAEDSEIYVCGVVEATLSGQPIAIAATMTRFPIVVKRSFVNKPRINFDKSTLRFAGILSQDGTTFASKTPDQTVGVTQVGAGTATWRVASIKDTTGAAVGYVSVTPSSGSGSGTTQIALIAHPALPRCTAQDGLGVVIEIVSDGTTQNEPQYIRAYITIDPATATGGCVPPTGPPVGVFDTPSEGASGLIGSIAVTGWAMDDVGVQKVEIWRNCVETIDRPAGACTSSAPGQPPNFVFIGTAAFLAGARPDIEAAFPLFPQAYRAGWGYLMSTNALPHLTPPVAPQGGQGSFTLFAFAVDVEGRYTMLGTKGISISNDTATIPFGSIDTPDQGGTVTVSPYANFGWAMTQSPKCIVTNSLSAYRVYINGVSRPLNPGVNWFTGLTRPDIAGAYPGRCNTNDALAAYYIDAAALGIASGLHTIGWDVIDDQGQIAGIGSRFFTLIVSSSLEAAEASPSIGPKLGRPAELVDGFRLSPEDVVAERQRTGYPLETLPSDGGRRMLVAEELERIQVDLPKTAGASKWEGYQVTRNMLGLLPMGSTFDADRGTFYWQPVAGYLGNYDFVFVRHGADGQQERVPVRVTYAPKQWTPVSPSTPIPRPSAQ